MSTVHVRKAKTPEEKGISRMAQVHVIEVNGRVEGWISKIRNTRTDIFPYQVFRRAPVGVIQPATVLATFYADKDIATILGGIRNPDDRAKEAEALKGGGLVAAEVFARRAFN